MIWGVLGAYLLLPVNTSFNIPGVPSLDKTTIPNLSILFCCLLFVRDQWLTALKDPTLVALATTFILSPFCTAFFNPEPLVYADHFIPAMSMYDALAESAMNMIILIPFIAAYGLINNDERRWQLIAILVAAGLGYSLLMLFEIRLSPQLHRIFYGFFPHSFGQQVRAGGFRPVVFLGHGLLVAILCSMIISAAVIRWRVAKGPKKTRAGLIAIYFGVLLLLCKSAGAIIIAAFFVPAAAFLRAKLITTVSASVCLMILFYPAVRSAELFPTSGISALTGSLSADRQDSFGVRLINEDQLLKRASEKPLFGWGSWGRNRIYSADDGRDWSTTDGAWIITLGSWGWAGYLSMFGLLCIGCARLLWGRKHGASHSIASAGLCMLLSINLIDSIPNSSIKPISWLIAGTILAISSQRQRRVRTDISSRNEQSDSNLQCEL